MLDESLINQVLLSFLPFVIEKKKELDHKVQF